MSSFYFLLGEEGVFSFNQNILETNLINIIILIALVLYFYTNLAVSILKNRQESIYYSINNLERTFTFALQEFIQAEKNYQSIFLKIKTIKKKTINKKKKFLQVESLSLKKEITNEVNSYKEALTKEKVYFDNEILFQYLLKFID